MKTLYAFIVLFISLPVAAQNWQCVQQGQKVYFTNADHYLRGMRIDSVRTQGTATVFYPFRSPRGKYLMNQVIDTNGGSWLGKKMIQQPGGNALFLNGWGDTVLIKTAANVGNQWTFYDDTSAVYYQATLQSAGVMTVAGVVDSIKTITIQAMQGGVNVTNNIANSCSIILSKNHGFVRVFDFYTFPFHEPGTQIYQPHFDYLLDQSSMINGIFLDSAKLLFTRIELQNATNADYGNFQVGDVLQYTILDDAGGGSFPTTRTDTILTRQMVAGIPQYTMGYRLVKYGPNAGTFPSYHITYGQTMVDWFTDIFGIDTLLMPEETGNQYFYSYDPVDTTHCIVERVFGKRYNNIAFGSATINTFEPCGDGKLFKASLGVVYYEHCSDPTPGNNFVGTLTFYKRGSIICGSVSTVSVRDESPQKGRFSIYPSPASDIVTVKYLSTGTLKNCQLEVTDITGRRVYSCPVAVNNQRIDVSKWASGVYLLRLKTPGQTYSQKVVIAH